MSGPASILDGADVGEPGKCEEFALAVHAAILELAFVGVAIALDQFAGGSFAFLVLADKALQ